MATLMTARAAPVADHDARRDWSRDALVRLQQEAARSADTHLLKLDLPAFPGIDFYFKDEAAHPTGSLKHRLARSLFLYALCNGRLHAGQPVVDASSGSTAISEAWFARLLGLPFTAVMPACTAPRKILAVEALGGVCDLVDNPADVHARAAWHAARGACHLDQFGLAERATDWRGNNNIAESILQQMAREPAPEPAWIVCGAGTGGTSATIGRYLRYRGLRTRLCVADPAGSAFVHGWRSRDRAAVATQPTLIEGIGRPRVEPGFVFEVVDAVIEVADTTSIAAAWLLEGEGSEIPFAAGDLVPEMSIENLVLVAGVLLGFTGMEIAGFHAPDTKNPRRDFPRAMIAAGKKGLLQIFAAQQEALSRG